MKQVEVLFKNGKIVTQGKIIEGFLFPESLIPKSISAAIAG